MKRHNETHEAESEHLVEDAKALMAATAHVAEEKVVEARKRLGMALERGKEMWNSVQKKAISSAKAADEAIREHPYQAVGVALGVGFLIGFLMGRRRD